MADDRLADFLNKLNDLANDYGLVVGGYELKEDQLHLLMIKTIEANEEED